MMSSTRKSSESSKIRCLRSNSITCHEHPECREDYGRAAKGDERRSEIPQRACAKGWSWHDVPERVILWIWCCFHVEWLCLMCEGGEGIVWRPASGCFKQFFVCASNGSDRGGCAFVFG
ncbi:hypothetical protein L596_027842 [Steinernema carpocapsae]|uniref:Uncharacterized protein n=1 Tax=Steinernema carpocapsae TaxID=34508 RepID=A0A4U5LWQ4_STECR|nr:hypothetical protein L596_027842 [Steinernema carpocapsae]